MVTGPVLIVGCGVFGLSTALELVKQGKFVSIIDKYEPPSPWAAANDFNKIIRCEYSNLMYAKLAVEALHLWRSDEIFQKSLNECGRILVTPTTHIGRSEFEMKGIQNLQKLGEGLNFEFYKGGKEVAKKFPCFADNDIPNNQQVKFNPEAGLGHSANSIKHLYEYLSSHPNVRCIFGSDGAAIGVKKYNDGEIGIITESGFVHTASTIILSAGANTGSILNLENQQSATGTFVTHIQLNDNEYIKYKSMPVLFDAEIGYFFPPDPATKIMKICLTGCGIKRSVADPYNENMTISLPRYKNEFPKDTIPKNAIPYIRALLKKYVPELQAHKLFGSKICWYGDREDSHFLIDKVPGYNNLYVATGDSGHGYKFLPNIGKYIVQRLDNILDKELADVWCWKSRLDAAMVDPSKQSWRIAKYKTQDLKDLNFVVEAESSKL
jgi:sarcosine oxidase/L-pipecolate oxidase/L-saccharopine oxidase